MHFVIATAGHVDHGKSALVQALTGTDPDRLPEEKARGITIQLGFAHLAIPASGRRRELHVGIVDVPGHEDFVKNMVGGVGSIDLALFVVAADDGWMPQTEEHLQILTYLDVTRAVVALTRIDLADSSEDATANAVREKLRHTAFAGAPIVGTSVVTGQGLEELENTLAEIFAEAPPQPDLGKPRLPIDRVFTLRGVGVVVTGTLSGGTFRRVQMVTVQPSAHAARIRSPRPAGKNAAF
ncbi:MAG: GTP-binding protein [Verrucomicrobiota bacterium]|nr:GTP-binding protein [Verrucomicrobiota bacterium]